MIFGEFQVDSDQFILSHTLKRIPETVVEIERVVASGKLLTPYMWVATTDVAEFEAAAGNDPTITNLHRIDEFDNRTFYRAEWTDNLDALLYAYQDVGAAITEAVGTNGSWDLRIQFESQEELNDFRSFCETHNIEYNLQRLYEASNVGKGAKYGLTQKQHEAATRAWEMGYFDSPREITLSEVAADLNISTQALSDRLRRAQYHLLAETLIVSSLSEYGHQDAD